MDDYDSVYTIRYKGQYIHARYNRITGKEEFTLQAYPTIILPSLLSAKQRVTKLLGK